MSPFCCLCPLSIYLWWWGRISVAGFSFPPNELFLTVRWGEARGEETAVGVNTTSSSPPKSSENSSANLTEKERKKERKKERNSSSSSKKVLSCDNLTRGGLTDREKKIPHRIFRAYLLFPHCCILSTINPSKGSNANPQLFPEIEREKKLFLGHRQWSD